MLILIPWILRERWLIGSRLTRKQEFVVADTPGKGFIHAFVNGTPVNQGEHINEYLRVIFEK